MTVTVLASAAVVLLVARLALFIHLHLVRPDLSPREHTVSDLGTGSSRTEFTVMGLLTAVAYVLVLVACVLQGVGPAVPLLALAIGAAAMLVMLCFPTDLTERTRTATGTVHWLLAVVQFTGLFVAMVNLDLTPVLRPRRWGSCAGWSGPASMPSLPPWCCPSSGVAGSASPSGPSSLLLRCGSSSSAQHSPSPERDGYCRRRRAGAALGAAAR
ncbi:DUF998 domain-containing protein [Gordonia iterans]